MKRLISLILLIAAIVFIIPDNAFAALDDFSEDPGSNKWGMWYTPFYQNQELSKLVYYDVGLRINIGSNYYKYDSVFSLGTIRNYSYNTYQNYGTDFAWYDDSSGYFLGIQAPEDYPVLQIESGTNSNNLKIRYKGNIEESFLGIFSYHDFIQFTIDGSNDIYTSTVTNFGDYSRSTEVFRLRFYPEEEEPQTPDLEYGEVVPNPGNEIWGLFHEPTYKLGLLDHYQLGINYHYDDSFVYNSLNGFTLSNIPDYTYTHAIYQTDRAFYLNDTYHFWINSPDEFKNMYLLKRSSSSNGSYDYYWNGVMELLYIQFSRADGLKVYVDDNLILSGNALLSDSVNGLYYADTSLNIGFYPTEDEVLPDPDPNPSEIIDVSNDFSLLPITQGNLLDAKTDKVGLAFFTPVSGKMYDVMVQYLGIQYNLGTIALPGIEETGQAPLNPGIYYAGYNDDRIIYYEFKLPPEKTPPGGQKTIFQSGQHSVDEFRTFAEMNLTTKKYTFTDKLQLYSVAKDKGNGLAYVDVLFPMEIDELLSISYKYRQRWKILWGLGYTSYETREVTRTKDEVVDMKSTWQYILAWNILGLNHAIDILTGNNFINTITEVNHLATNDYKERFVRKINEVEAKKTNGQIFTEEEIFKNEYSLYEIYLNTFSDGRYTGWQIEDNIVLLDVMYQYKGIVYNVPYSDIDHIGSGVSSDDPTFGGFPALQINVGLIVFGLVFVLGVFTHKPGISNLKLKDVIRIAIIAAIIAVIVHFTIASISISTKIINLRL